jgi:hypothetical protein
MTGLDFRLELVPPEHGSLILMDGATVLLRRHSESLRWYRMHRALYFRDVVGALGIS